MNENNKEVQFDSCPKCGYFLVKNSLLAECARCDYSTNKENHKERIATEKGFKSYKHYKNFFMSLIK